MARASLVLSAPFSFRVWLKGLPIAIMKRQRQLTYEQTRFIFGLRLLPQIKWIHYSEMLARVAKGGSVLTE